jgi:TonB family protein
MICESFAGHAVPIRWLCVKETDVFNPKPWPLLRRTCTLASALIAFSLTATASASSSKPPRAAPAASTEPQSEQRAIEKEMTTIPEDLGGLLDDLLAAANMKDKAKVAEMLEKMRIPNQEAWFRETFGEEQGPTLSAMYKARVEADEQSIADRLVSAAAVSSTGRMFALLVPREPFDGEFPPLSGFRASLRRSTDFYAVSYLHAPVGGPPGGLRIQIGFLTKMDGEYKRLPAALLWLLKQPEPPPGAASYPGTDVMHLFRLVASVPPPVPPMPPPPPQTPGFASGAAADEPVCEVLDKATGRLAVQAQCEAGKLVSRISPDYPPLARQTRISGTVRLHAIIGKDGSVQQLEVISGHPLLIGSAINAVKQWRYTPTLLEGKPVEVDTEIDVIFALN